MTPAFSQSPSLLALPILETEEVKRWELGGLGLGAWRTVQSSHLEFSHLQNGNFSACLLGCAENQMGRFTGSGDFNKLYKAKVLSA